MNKITCYDLENGEVAVKFGENTEMPEGAIIGIGVEVSDGVLEILQGDNWAERVRLILNNIADEQFI